MKQSLLDTIIDETLCMDLADNILTGKQYEYRIEREPDNDTWALYLYGPNRAQYEYLYYCYQKKSEIRKDLNTLKEEGFAIAKK